MPKHETLHRKIAELIWGMDQDSVETPLDKLKGPALDDVLDTTDAIVQLVAQYARMEER